ALREQRFRDRRSNESGTASDEEEASHALGLYSRGLDVAATNLAVSSLSCDPREMERRKRAVNVEQTEHGACVVCGTRDARLLVTVELQGGAVATLCGSHALMHSRTGETARNVTELRAALAERRAHDRRAEGEGDELAERLTAAFTRERRSSERRAN